VGGRIAGAPGHPPGELGQLQCGQAEISGDQHKMA
jgi:hypothetical protein